MTSFSQWTQADVERHNARCQRENQIAPSVDAVAAGEEDRLHEEILKECNRRGWIALHGSMARRTARTEGEWDFVILADAGRVFFVECKTARAKQSNEQLGLHHWAIGLGHKPAVVRSMSEFLEVVRE